MKFLAHRGLWRDRKECNTIEALRAAIREGFGVETDLRDASGLLVISHDPPEEPTLELSEFLEFYRSSDCSAPLALNIKADGLSGRLHLMLAEFAVHDYFCFDMSVPEMLACARNGLKMFTRESEFETQPVLYQESQGMWMDVFLSDWVTSGRIQEHLKSGKQVALVSPELHRRSHLEFWARLRSAGLGKLEGLMLCTDFPLEARDFFHE